MVSPTLKYKWKSFFARQLIHQPILASWRGTHEFGRVSLAVKVLLLDLGQRLVDRWPPFQLPYGLLSRLRWRLEQGEKLANHRIGYETVGRYGKILLDAHLDSIGLILLPLKLQELVVRDLVLGLPSLGVSRRLMLSCQTTRSTSLKKEVRAE